MVANNHLVLIDGMGFVFRAYHAVRQNLTRADGLPTGALFGFAQMLVKVVNDLKPSACAVVLDSKPPGWRHAIYADYKANRPPPDEALLRQLPFIEPLVAAFGLPTLRLDGYEADDILATFVARAAADKHHSRITVVTSDKDLLQLVSESEHLTVKLLDTLSETWRGPAECLEKFGVPPSQVVQVQALMGDSSDNIPGAPGVGPKTAAELIQQFGTLENLYANLNDVKRDRLRSILADNKDKVFMSRQLASLKADVPLPPTDLTFHPNLAQASTYLQETLEFKTLAARLEKTPAGYSTKPPLEASSAPRAQAVPMLFSPPPAQPITASPTSAPWGPYTCITTQAEWETWATLAEAQGYAALDTETTSLHPHSAQLVGISLALAAGKACYIPLNHTGGAADDMFGGGRLAGQLSETDVLPRIRSWLESGRVKIICHNLKYDVQVLARALGVLNNPAALHTLCAHAEDTLLMSACLDAGRWSHGLDSLTERHLNHTNIPFAQVAGIGKNAVTFNRVSLEAATAYAAEDADATWRLYQLFKARLAEPNSGTPTHGPSFIYNGVEKPLLPTIASMEAVGVVVDAPYLQNLSNGWAIKLAEYEAAAHAAAGRPFNLASPAQLGVVLFDELKLGSDKQKAKKGTGIDVLEDLLEAATEHANPTATTLLNAVIAHRSLAKLRSTYAEALVAQVHPSTHRVHTSYLQIGAATGRFSSTDPNLQNIPIRTEDGRLVRKAFIPQKGMVMLSADYSQIELRLLAHFSDSTQLKKAFFDGLDIHAYTASLVAGIPLENVTRDQRRAAKFVNFGLVYGMGARSLAAQIGCSTAEATEWITAYFKRYEGVREYMDANKLQAKEKGYVETLLGRRVHLPDIHSQNGAFRSNAERAAINAPLQGSNADVIKLAMPKVEALATQHGAHLLLQVHDELVLECPPESVEDLKATLPQTMTNVVQLSVPLAVEVGSGPNWDAAH